MLRIGCGAVGARAKLTTCIRDGVVFSTSGGLECVEFGGGGEEADICHCPGVPGDFQHWK